MNGAFDLEAALREITEIDGSPVRAAAASTDGFLVPLPESLQHLPFEPIAVPDPPINVMELLVPGDRFKVLGLRDESCRVGMGIGQVRLLEDPDRPATLVIADLREEHGVFLCLLRSHDAEPAAAEANVPAEALHVRRTPRPASLHKTVFGIITGIDANTTEMLGWTAGEMVGERSTEFIHPDDQERAIGQWMDMLTDKVSQRVRYRHRCRDGRWLWVEVEHICHDVSNPEGGDIEACITDVSEEMEAHEAVQRREELFSRLADSMPTGVLQVDASGAAIFVNRRMGEYLGMPSGSVDLDALIAAVAEDDRSRVRNAFERALDGGEDHEVEVAVGSAGPARRFTMNVVAVENQDGSPGALVCATDVTDSARLREVLRRRATFDILTGCHNRGSVLAELEAVLREPQGDTGILFIDLDAFKPINDQLGHASGDELLVAVARRLETICRGGDLVGRIGGDEFLVVCPEMDGVTETMAFANRVHEGLREPFVLRAGTVSVGASIGVAFASPDTSSDELVSRADDAMYEAKREHGGPVLAQIDLRSVA